MSIEPAPGSPPDSPLQEARSVHASHFARGLAAWRSWPLAWHLGAVVLLAALAAGRWWPIVTGSAERIDEHYYLEASRAVLEGGSPYEQDRFYYPPAFAFAGAALLERLGEPGVVALLRSANLLALGALAWCSFAWAGSSWSLRLAAAAVCVCLAPGANLGVRSGNVSPIVIAMIFFGLLFWRRLPWLAGAALGASAAIKPISPVAMLALLAHRPPAGGRRQQLAGAVGLALAAGLLLAFPYFDEMLELGRGPSRNLRTVSLHRLLYSLGLEVGASTVAAAVAVLTVLAVRRRPLAPTHFLCVALAAVTLAAPMLWNHTLLVALPLQVLAVALALRRRRGAAAGRSACRRYELALVILGVAAIQLCDGVGGVEDRAAWIQVLAVAVPCFAPAALAAYVLKTTDPF